MKRRGFLAGAATAFAALFVPRSIQAQRRGIVEVLSNDLMEVDGKPVRRMHLRVPFSKADLFLQLNNGRRMIMISGYEEHTDPWTSIFANMWKTAEETLSDLQGVKERDWLGLRVVMDCPDGRHEMLGIIPHDVTMKHVRLLAPGNLLT